METPSVFVYGTLMRGFRNHCLLEGATFVGKAITAPNYLLYDSGPYPCLIEVGEGKGRRIQGEIYTINKAILSKLDHLEGVPHLYKRKKAKARMADKKGEFSLEPFVYVYNRSVESFLDCGTSWPRS